MVGGRVGGTGDSRTPVPVGVRAVVEGLRIEQNRSRFAAFAGPCGNETEASLLVASLVAAHRLAKATHLSWAARYPGPEGRMADLKSDGGEPGAGMAILEVMQSMGAERSLVLVARWYGGRHLGGARFRIYRRLTRDLLEDAQRMT